MKTGPPIHPGEHLAEILSENGLTAHKLAKAIGVSPVQVSGIIGGERAITAETAVRLGYAFCMTAEYWMNLQRFYDLQLAREKIDEDSIERLLEPVDMSEFDLE